MFCIYASAFLKIQISWLLSVIDAVEFLFITTFFSVRWCETNLFYVIVSYLLGTVSKNIYINFTVSFPRSLPWISTILSEYVSEWYRPQSVFVSTWNNGSEKFSKDSLLDFCSCEMVLTTSFGLELGVIVLIYCGIPVDFWEICLKKGKRTEICHHNQMKQRT